MTDLPALLPAAVALWTKGSRLMCADELEAP
jgi:hypothetical protein